MQSPFPWNATVKIKARDRNLKIYDSQFIPYSEIMAKLHQINRNKRLDDKLLNKVAKYIPKQNNAYTEFLERYLHMEDYEIQNELSNNRNDVVLAVFKLLCKWRDNTHGASVGMLVEKIDNAVEGKVFSSNWHRNGKGLIILYTHTL